MPFTGFSSRVAGGVVVAEPFCLFDYMLSPPLWLDVRRTNELTLLDGLGLDNAPALQDTLLSFNPKAIWMWVTIGSK